jgi:hypothetical protein
VDDIEATALMRSLAVGPRPLVRRVLAVGGTPCVHAGAEFIRARSVEVSAASLGPFDHVAFSRDRF